MQSSVLCFEVSFSNSYLQTMFQEPLREGMLFGKSFSVHSRSSPRIGA
jgi:hypothetical protein